MNRSTVTKTSEDSNTKPEGKLKFEFTPVDRVVFAMY